MKKNEDKRYVLYWACFDCGQEIIVPHDQKNAEIVIETEIEKHMNLHERM